MKLEAGTLLQHYKGKQYRVLGVGHHTETLERMVAYQALYDDPTFGPNAVWMRPESMFSETVKYEGSTLPRFIVITSQ